MGHRVEVHVTWEGGDSQRFASQPGEAEVIVAIGGDGTGEPIKCNFQGLL